MGKIFIVITIFVLIIIGALVILKFHRGDSIAYSKTGTFKLDSWGNGAPSLIINITPDYELKKHKGVDFDVYYFSKHPSNSSIGIYLGHHPSLLNPKEKVSKIAGKIQDKEITWIEWKEVTNGNVEINRETVISNFFPDKNTDFEGLIIHIFIKGNNKEKIDMLQQYAETIRILKD